MNLFGADGVQRPMVSRRVFLGGGLAGLGGLMAGGLALVEEGVLPGKVRLDKTLGRCGDVPPAPAVAGVVRPGTLRSRHRGRDVGVVVVLPAGVNSLKGLPVVVALHGNGGTAEAAVSGLALDRYLTDAARKVRPFALVAVDGGASSYWHTRSSGDDPIAMIVEELLPWLRRQGARTGRFGAIGWSMGGYGALVLAQTVGAPRVSGVVASSPALFSSYKDAQSTNGLAFDDAADFARQDVFRRLDRLRGVPVRVDCGNSDPFAPMVEQLRGRLRPAGGMSKGCHDGAFWRARLPDQLDFLGRHLA
ncbi:hypothetical protein GCM10010191_54270 [Actinomadura vinacea]|uniref:Acyl-CoA:diacylglycerol acyltransferase n=1 Tax=Actinomadura vinacea TaxID=115336 RepID=A0ABN3JNE7_9ACTN